MPKAFRCIITSAPRFDFVVDDGHIRPRQDSDEDKKLTSPLGITVDIPYRTPDGEIESLMAYAMAPIDENGEIEIGYIAVALAKISMVIQSHLSEPEDPRPPMIALAGDKSIN